MKKFDLGSFVMGVAISVAGQLVFEQLKKRGVF